MDMTVSGRIVDFEDYQEQELTTKKPKFCKNPGPDGKPQPVVGVFITLEVVSGDPTTRVPLWAAGAQMIRVIATAVESAGARDLERGAYLTVTRSGEAYQATYARPEAA